ncbi:hypothetical protein [Microvirga makkahensis]|uniref:HTH crp-type domain-containing protein n=1 Tax=Microvirga makkahensis TaxID=1128670 RepID=A0A7X3MWZ3_9HYPH|nr:hypothetical protein [Microvirga makkahensis]MXQ14813.1 hypothetical protein [Microvirga makkahensis]
MNRVIRNLRQEGLVTWRGDLVEVRDWVRFCDYAEFDPTYLHLEDEPR